MRRVERKSVKKQRPGLVPSAGEEVNIAIDLAEQKWVYNVRWGGGEQRRLVTPAGLEHLESLVRQYESCAIRIAYEACGFGFEISWWAAERGIETVVVPPSTVEQAPGRRVKTDRIDARKLAEKLEKRELKSVWVPSPEQHEKRQLVRTHVQMSKERRRIQTQLRSMMREHCRRGPGTQSGWKAYERWLREIDLPHALRVCVDRLLRLREEADRCADELEAELRRLSRSERYKPIVDSLCKAKGIGWLTAIRLILELGEVQRFPTRGSLPHYLGLTPSEYSSGQDQYRGPLLKFGPKKLRSWLIEAAWTAIRYDPKLQEHFRRIGGHAPQRSDKKKAIAAVARRLAVQLRALWLEAVAAPVAA